MKAQAYATAKLAWGLKREQYLKKGLRLLFTLGSSLHRLLIFSWSLCTLESKAQLSKCARFRFVAPRRFYISVLSLVQVLFLLLYQKILRHQFFPVLVLTHHLSHRALSTWEGQTSRARFSTFCSIRMKHLHRLPLNTIL